MVKKKVFIDINTLEEHRISLHSAFAKPRRAYGSDCECVGVRRTVSPEWR